MKLAIAVLLLWSGRQLWIWRPSGPGFATGWWSSVDAAVILTAFCLGLFAFRSAAGLVRIWLAVAILAAIGVDYKAFGTSKRINASPSNIDHLLAHARFPGMEDKVYNKLRADPEYRVGLERDDPVPYDLRHYGLTTPQGGDPLAPAQYRRVLAPDPADGWYGPLEIDPRRHDLLRLLGVRYFITSEGKTQYAHLKGDPDWILLEPCNSYFKVFEFSKARPSYYWETDHMTDWIKKTHWSAESRQFTVHSDAGGKFILVEQYVPGWFAFVDNQPVPVQPWHFAFQSVAVPPGDHMIRFMFQSNGFRLGALISALTLAALVFCTARP